MKLEELNNEYRNGDGEVKKIIPLGYVGSRELYHIANERLGHNCLYYISIDGWVPNAGGSSTETFYGIEERDFHLFEAYDHLEEGWEMIGYGEGIVFQEEYKHSKFDIRTKKFSKHLDWFIDPKSIYARRKKEELGVITKEVRVRVNIETCDKFYDICRREGKTLAEKISEWVDADNAQKKAKRSRAEVMRDIKKELEDAWSEEEAPGEMVKGAEFLLDLITEGGMKFK